MGACLHGCVSVFLQEHNSTLYICTPFCETYRVCEMRSVMEDRMLLAIDPWDDEGIPRDLEMFIDC